MLSVVLVLIQILYTLAVLGLALYGLHSLWLVSILLFPSAPGSRRPETFVAKGLGESPPPQVTVQLPIFNEQHVAERLIDAAANLQYPREALQIQVLDDSTDETTSLVEDRARFWRSRGLNIEVIHRTDRVGFKAGALDAALPRATGEFIALFDADFVPNSDFLLSTLPHFLGEKREVVGFVQGRWGHLNSVYSPLTRSQALALDGHFAVEQSARQKAGLPFGFNGSAGIWRRCCIEDPAVGGWQHDTLCEDLDLSYRAQLAGWVPCYLNDLVVPAEIPPQLLAFKRQQSRWAQGSIQTLRKLGCTVWKSEWRLRDRLSGLFHLATYLIHPLLLLLLGTTAVLIGIEKQPLWPLAYLSLASIGPPLLYAVAQRRIEPRGWFRRWLYLGILTLLGMGISLSNTLAAVKGLKGVSSPFLRTPKFRVQEQDDSWYGSSYRLHLEPLMFGELSLFLLASGSTILAWQREQFWALPLLLLFSAGYGLLLTVGLWQSGTFGRSAEGFGAGQSERVDGATPTHPPFQTANFVKSRGR